MLSRVGQIIMIKCATPYARTMLAADHYPDLYPDVAISNRQLFEIHHSKVSLHHSKEGYDYPTIRLPRYLFPLAGLSTRIYQTVHEGALAFLVVVSSVWTPSESRPANHENAMVSANHRLYTAGIVCSNHTEPMVSFLNRTRELRRNINLMRMKSCATLRKSCATLI